MEEGQGRPQPLEVGRQGLQVSWLLVAGSTTPRALPRRATQQQVHGAAGDGIEVEQVGGVVEGAGAGDLAVQVPPHARQELLGKGRPGGLAGDPARPWPCSPGCGGGACLGLLLSRPWSICRRAVVSPHSKCGSCGGPWCPGSLITSSWWWGTGQEIAGHPGLALVSLKKFYQAVSLGRDECG